MNAAEMYNLIGLCGYRIYDAQSNLVAELMLHDYASYNALLSYIQTTYGITVTPVGNNIPKD